MNWRILVQRKTRGADPRGEELKKEARWAGLTGVRRVRAGQIYELSGDLDASVARRLADDLLTDPVTQESVVFPAGRGPRPPGGRRTEIWLKKGVADPVADTVRLAAEDVGVGGLAGVRSGHVFDFDGAVSPQAVQRFCEEHLMNPLIQTVNVR